MNNFLSSAMEKFYEMTLKDPVIDIDGKKYRRDGYGAVAESTVDSLETHTLQGIVDAVNSKIEPAVTAGLHIHIASPTQVFLESESFGPFLQRHTLIGSSAYVTDFRFGRGYDVEQFIIALHSQFIQGDDRDTVLKLVSKITKETSGTVSDDGVSQKMEVKQGLSMREKVKVKNPFVLQPYRTFPEISQPASAFVFRVRDQNGHITCSLHEADGSKWKIEAIESIKAFFKEKLPEIPVIA